MPDKKVNSALVGSLVGLGLGALARKVVAGDQKVGWGDYALWGGIGAGIGGAAGYGLSSINTEKPSDEQKQEAAEKVIEAGKALHEAQKDAKDLRPGLTQMLSGEDWLSLAFWQGLPGAINFGARKLGAEGWKQIESSIQPAKDKAIRARTALYNAKPVTGKLADILGITWKDIKNIPGGLKNFSLKTSLKSSLDALRHPKLTYGKLLQHYSTPRLKKLRRLKLATKLADQKLNSAIKAAVDVPGMGLAKRLATRLKGTRGALGMALKLGVPAVAHALSAAHILGNSREFGDYLNNSGPWDRWRNSDYADVMAAEEAMDKAIEQKIKL